MLTRRRPIQSRDGHGVFRQGLHSWCEDRSVRRREKIPYSIYAESVGQRLGDEASCEDGLGEEFLRKIVARESRVRHPRKAGGLMGWTASKAVGYWFRRRAEARLSSQPRNCPLVFHPRALGRGCIGRTCPVPTRCDCGIASRYSLHIPASRIWGVQGFHPCVFVSIRG